jgi:hypothetical protein
MESQEEVNFEGQEIQETRLPADNSQLSTVGRSAIQGVGEGNENRTSPAGFELC